MRSFVFSSNPVVQKHLVFTADAQVVLQRASHAPSGAILGKIVAMAIFVRPRVQRVVNMFVCLMTIAQKKERIVLVMIIVVTSWFASHRLLVLPVVKYGVVEPRENTGCFSSSVRVSVKGKIGKLPIREIQVGEKVLTASGKYETVYSIDHFDPTKSAKFLQIYTASNYDDENKNKNGERLQQATPLELTPRHMVFLHGRLNPIPASAVKVGDFLQTTNANKHQIVTQISSVVREGVYNPLTIDGTIVVNNDVVTSVYSAFVGEDDESEYIEILGGYKITTHQSFFHTILKPYKSVCTGISLELCRTEEERSAIGRFGTIVYRRWSRQDKFIQNLLLIPVVVVTIITDIIIMNPYSFITTLLPLIVSLANGQMKKL